MNATERARTRSPWAFVPALYFLQGLPNAVVAELSTAYFTQMGVALVDIGRWSSLLKAPYVLKPLWAPFVDTRSSKRRWVIGMQLAVSIGLAACAFQATAPSALIAMLGLFALIAFASATHDIAADGFYILSLDAKDQAAFVGVRNLFFRLASLFGGGVLLWLAGRLQTAGVALPEAWRWAFLCGAVVYGICAVANAALLPRPPSDVPRAGGSHSAAPRASFGAVVSAYLRQPRLPAILAFILLYRLAESMISAFSTPFLLRARAVGGLGVSAEDVGILKGTVGLVALIAGGLAGGVVISRFGIKRCFWPMVLAMNVPNVFYVWAAVEPPSRFLLGGLLAVDQFGYGFGFSAYMVYLMFVSRGSRFATAHYAISTGLMALSALAATLVSGYLVDAFGFVRFFAIVCAASVPGMLTLFFIPMDGDDLYTAPVDAP